MSEAEVRQVTQMYALVAEMYATVAWIEGLKALNQERLANGCSPGYSEQQFFEQFSILNRIAENLRTQI